MLRVLTLSTLYPHAGAPQFGIFVAGQTLRLAAREDVELQVVNPVAAPVFPLGWLPRYRGQRRIPLADDWGGVPTLRPRFHTVPGLSGGTNPGAIVRAVRPVLRRLRADGFAFDLIDAEFFYPDGPAAARLAREFAVPFTIKARGADIHYWGAIPAARRQMLAAASQAAGLLAVSASLRRDMAALGMDAGKVAVHYTGVDLDRFRLADRAAAKAALGVVGDLVVSLGSLIPRKGHALVIEAMLALPDATLLIAGAGPERAALAALIAARGLGSRVRLLGAVPHAGLPAILAAADVMALASASEGLANAWVEAMACGTPVVTMAVDGAAEAIDPAVSGRLLTERTPAALSAAITSVLRDPPRPEAVRRSVAAFTWERNTQTLHDFFRRCVGGAVDPGR